MAIGSPQWMYKSGEAYEVDQSLRFESSRSTYLSKTPTSAGNQKTWTWSGWVTKTKNSRDIIMSTTNGGTSFLSFGWTSGGTYEDKFYLYWYDGSTDYGYFSTRLFRDYSSFYHIVLAVDTTQATESNRIKLYVNGVEEPFAANNVYGSFPQNHDTYYNDNNVHYIGYNHDSSSAKFNGYLAEVHSIDGQALTPADFGETGDYGEWKPIEYEGTYGTNGFYLNFAGGGVMSATGGDTTNTDGDYKALSFESNGTFTPSADGYVEYLVIGGGGAGAASGASQYHGGAGGGGAGAYRTGYLPVTGGTGYPIVVGAGGTGVTYAVSGGGARGSSSSFSTITSTGGGGGSAYGYPASPSNTGGNNSSGGGGQGKSDNSSHAGGAGGTYGNSGGDGHAGGTAGAPNYGAGGGGGSGAAGADGTTSAGGNGGAGTASSITGSSVTRAGGGGGSTFNNQGTQGSGGSGGGGAAGSSSGTNGTANTGSGGGGAKDASGATGGSGGSGIVIIRYKFQ